MPPNRSSPCRRQAVQVAAGALLVLAAALWAAPAAHAAPEAIVVASTAPGVVQGQRIGAHQPVSLPDGSRTVFLLATGQMVEIEGPFHGPVVAGEDGSDRLLSLAAATVGRDLSVIGGTRTAASDAPSRGKDLVLSIDRPMVICVQPRDRLHLRRPHWEAAGTARLEDAGTGASAEVAWPAGVAVVRWPAALPLRDGATVHIRPDKAAAPGATLRLHLLDATLDGPAWIAALVSAGCTEQAAPHLAALAARVAPLALFVSTNRGETPTYREGEEIVFVIQANRDAHLYCYLSLADGTVVPVFPASAVGGAHVAGHALVTIPGDRLPIQFRARGAGSQDRLDCYASERDLSAELPPVLTNPTFMPLPPEFNPARTFASLADVQVAQASVTLQVE